MAALPDIPSNILDSEDKSRLIAFMEENYKSHLDKRKGWEKILVDAKASMKRKRVVENKHADNVSRIDKFNTKMTEHATRALSINPRAYFLLENDTSKWPWDFERVEWLEAGIGWGSCRIKLKTQDRIVAVSRETASAFFVKE